MAYHSRFVADGHLGVDDPLIVEHESLCRIFETAIVADQLHVSRLLCLELVCRGLQRITIRYRERFLGKPAVDNQGGKKGKPGQPRAFVSPEVDMHLFVGSGETRGRITLHPGFAEWLAERKGKEVALLREDRKLAQERRFLAGDSGPPKET